MILLPLIAAIKIGFDIANSVPSQVKDIAMTNSITPKEMAQILKDLKTDGIEQ